MVVPPNDFPLLYLYEKWQDERKKKGLQPFGYYRTRADDEGLEKLTFFSLHALKYGVVAGVIDGIAITEVTTLSQYLGRIGFWTVPLVGSFGAFVATNHLLTKITGKDTWQTHAVGGLAAAAVWGGKFRSTRLGLCLSVPLVVWCALKKWSVDNNVPMGATPAKHGKEYMYIAQQYDMSIIKSP